MSGVLTVPGNGSTRAIVGGDEERAGVRPDEARIIAWVHARQHRRAVEHAARAFGPELHRFFARWYPSEAEDLVQETLVRVYEAFRRDRFQAHMGFTGWLFKIATNLRRDHHRKVRRRGDLLHAHAHAISRDLHGDGAGQGTWNSLTRQEQRWWLEQTIRTLPDEDQELLALRYDAALPWTEVARVLGVRISTAKLKFTQLRRVLVERWER
ncbi:MAG: hypothetical protein CVU56_16250 [Deltaproteobacteria bacterium HGW-Deltaproteobacteria-14]|jgi:RNA polymerase sigma factor (sigma-70 family)|nr:MAG: hypothetical protein CVU56_16250 [Deltaproteobacteria bacterium HGW-Deltaproteobacteria-14]